MKAKELMIGYKRKDYQIDEVAQYLCAQLTSIYNNPLVCKMVLTKAIAQLDNRNIAGEIWKEMPDYEGLYLISNKGRVKSCSRTKNSGSRFEYLSKEIMLKPSISKDGYLTVYLCKNGKMKSHALHRLVAIAFIPNGGKLSDVNHKDENKLNNDVDNLEWCSASENCKHAFRTGLRENQVKGKFGKDHIASRPFVCVETGKVYNCLRELAEDFGEDFNSTSHIARACRYGLLDHGFHWRYYEPNELVKLLFSKGYTKYPESYDGDSWFCYVQMAMKWLREVHHCVICITPLTFYCGEIVSKWGYCIWADDNTEVDEESSPKLESYEEACENAIRYCLENLI